jgi:hypothetical protein
MQILERAGQDALLAGWSQVRARARLGKSKDLTQRAQRKGGEHRESGRDPSAGMKQNRRHQDDDAWRIAGVGEGHDRMPGTDSKTKEPARRRRYENPGAQPGVLCHEDRRRGNVDARASWGAASSAPTASTTTEPARRRRYESPGAQPGVAVPRRRGGFVGLENCANFGR